MHDDYKRYQSLLGEVPTFLNKYLNLDIMQRLKDISLLCGMEYASSYIYNFSFYISRFDHSLNVALITWNLTHDKTQTLAGLFHDISSPTFSHVVDYMNGDTVKQESTEDKISEILLNSDELKKMLISDEVDINDVINFKKYSIVDNKRPMMCADRLDNIISVGMAWIQKVKYEETLLIISDIKLINNEFNNEEISFKTLAVAKYVKNINDSINEYTHTKEDTYMMLLLSKILKIGIKNNLFTYDDLFKLREYEVVDIITDNLDVDDELESLWKEFISIKNVPNYDEIEIKDKVLDPVVKGKRLSKIQSML